MKFGKIVAIILFFFLLNLNTILYAQENKQNDKTILTETKQSNDHTSIKLKLPQDLIKDQEHAVGSVKIDDETTAKITISSKENSKNEKPKKDINVEIKKELLTTNNQKQKPVEYIIQKDVDLDSQNNNYIVIKDGDKNINIFLKPNFVACKTCKNGVKNNNTTKVIKTTLPQNKKTINKKNTKTSKNINNQKNTNIQNNNAKDTKDIKEVKEKVNNNDFIEITTIPDKKQEHKSIRKIYENGEMSCVGDNCGVIINSKKKNENKKENYNNANNNVKIIEKETKVIEQPVYVVNRIINVDEDMNITDEQLNQLVVGKDGHTTVINGKQDKKIISRKKNRNVNDKFKQQYDIIEANNIAYGEVAFVDDYND